jgi:hypothetical protein
MRVTYNNMSDMECENKAYEVQRAAEDNFGMELSALASRWVRIVLMEDPAYSSFGNIIRQIVRGLAKRHVDVFTIFKRMLETVPPEICQKHLTFREFSQIVAVQAIKVL